MKSMKFELHCHSWHSKGKKITWEGLASPAEVVRHAKNIGLSGIAITDHLITDGWKEAEKEARKQDIMFIPGVELETQSGHVLALGVNGSVKNFKSLEETVDLIHDAAGIAISSHPFDMRGEGARNLATKADGVEIFNSINVDRISNRLALAKFKDKSIPKIVGSDAHTLEMIGNSVNIMKDVHDVDSVLKSIVRGNVEFKTRYVTIDEMINWARGRLIKSEKDVLEYTNAHYNRPKAWLYRKMLKKFINTGNAPWWILGEMSIYASMAYAGAKMFTYR